jgi:hypothetical protein
VSACIRVQRYKRNRASVAMVQVHCSPLQSQSGAGSNQAPDKSPAGFQLSPSSSSVVKDSRKFPAERVKGMADRTWGLCEETG